MFDFELCSRFRISCTILNWALDCDLRILASARSIYSSSISIDFDWFRLISINFYWFRLISIDFDWFRLVCIDFDWFLLISIHFDRVRLISIHFDWFGFFRFPLISIEFDFDFRGIDFFGLDLFDFDFVRSRLVRSTIQRFVWFLFSFDRCNAPAKLPAWRCLPHRSASQTAVWKQFRIATCAFDLGDLFDFDLFDLDLGKSQQKSYKPAGGKTTPKAN